MKERKADIIYEMIQEGKTDVEIRSALGVSYDYVYKIRRFGKREVRMRQDSWDEEETALFATLYPILCPIELMQVFGRCRNSIDRKARRMKLKKGPGYEEHVAALKAANWDISSSIRAYERPPREEGTYVVEREVTDHMHLDAMGIECGWGKNFAGLGAYGRGKGTTAKA